MVDCGNIRCAHERRNFKKELLTWTKKVPIALGLEEIARHYGEEKVDDLFKSFYNLETDEVRDWEPQVRCTFCEERNSHIKNSINSANIEDVDPKQHTEMKCLSDIRPYAYNPWIMLPSYDINEPLDLSMSSPLLKCSRNTQQTINRFKVGSDDEDLKSHTELKVPKIKVNSSKKKSTANGRRSYTEIDLMAAVKDIKDGKVGTRRASVLYGIPRSTLRNKIFRMEAQQNRVNQEIKETAKKLAAMSSAGMSVSPFDRNTVSFGAMMNGLMENALAVNPHNNLTNQVIGQSGPKVKEDEGRATKWETKLEQMRYKHNLDGHDVRNSIHDMKNKSSPHNMTENNSKRLIKSRLPFSMPDLVKRLTEQRMKALDPTHFPDANSVSPKAHSISNSADMSSSSSSDAEMNDDKGEVKCTSTSAALKVPSFARSSNNNMEDSTEESEANYEVPATINGLAGSSPTISETLREIISKTISEKIRSKVTEIENISVNSGLRVTQFQSDYESPNKRPKTSNFVPIAADYHHSNMKQNLPKKTRPKRGQYRKYNNQLLLEAVRAVQRGEMSVHRAGSYYGVPHSTLEYKVKERHLLRQKKMAEKREAEAAALAVKSSSCEPEEKKSLPMSSFITSSLSQGNVTSDTSPEAPPNGHGFAVTTPASELLRRLQQKVQANIIGINGNVSPVMSNENIEPINGQSSTIGIPAVTGSH